MIPPEEKIKIWKEYEEKLFSEENEWSRALMVVKAEGPCEKISAEMIALDLVNA